MLVFGYAPKYENGFSSFFAIFKNSSAPPHETLKNHPLCKKSIKALLMLHLKPTSEFLMPVSSLIDARSVEKKIHIHFQNWSSSYFKA